MALSGITTHIQFLSILIVKVQFKNNNIRYVVKTARTTNILQIILLYQVSCYRQYIMENRIFSN